MSKKQKRQLERCKGALRDFKVKILRSEDMEEAFGFVKEAFDIVDQVTARADVAEERIVRLEEFDPQTFDHECPECSYKTQFSLPGSNWWRRQTNLARTKTREVQERAQKNIKEIANLQELIKTLEKEITDGQK